MGLLSAAVAGALAYKLAPKLGDAVVADVTVPLVGRVPSACLVGVGAAVVTLALQAATAPPSQPCKGAVLVTGCDSGMGYNGAIHLAGLGFHVFAAVYMDDSAAKLRVEAGAERWAKITPLQLDVTNTDSINTMVAALETKLAELGIGLVAVINCAGVGYTGPAEFFPLDMYRRQWEVNFLGYVAVTQAVLPLIRRATTVPTSRRGRVVFVGTGGGVMSPAPALLSAYMASKWAGEAWMQCFRMEMQLTGKRIDGSMINPGFIKPTALVAGGKVLIERMWQGCGPAARSEYESFLDRFQKHSDNEPGTHPRYVSQAMEQILAAATPNLSYKVGPDSKAAPFVGLLPTYLRERLVRFAIYKQ